MNERLKSLRKTLNLSQDNFGERIGMTGGGVSLLEKGKRNITEQVIKSICREFNVDYIWLTTGVGEMFISYDDSETMELLDRILSEENEFTKTLFKTFLKLDSKDIEALERILDQYIAQKKGTAD